MAWGVLSLIGIYWRPLHAPSEAACLFAMAIGCLANWLRNRSFHCAITGPLFLIAGVVFPALRRARDPRQHALGSGDSFSSASASRFCWNGGMRSVLRHGFEINRHRPTMFRSSTPSASPRKASQPSRTMKGTKQSAATGSAHLHTARSRLLPIPPKRSAERYPQSADSAASPLSAALPVTAANRRFSFASHGMNIAATNQHGNPQITLPGLWVTNQRHGGRHNHIRCQSNEQGPGNTRSARLSLARALQEPETAVALPPPR